VNLRLWVYVFLCLTMADLSAIGAPLQKTTRIVAIGDSTTAGSPFFRSPLEFPPDGSGDPEGQYSYWMMRKRPQWDVLNYGVTGETTSQIRARFEETYKQSPRYIIILAGVNDIYQGLPLQSVINNLFWMYQQAEGHGIMPVAGTVLPFDTATPEQAKAIDELNKWIKKAADKMRMPIADLNAAVSDPNDPHKLNGSPDGIHPDVGGYRSMAMSLVEAIDPIEKAWR
jgi:lysophospholipase L1-like esterase